MQVLVAIIFYSIVGVIKCADFLVSAFTTLRRRLTTLNLHRTLPKKRPTKLRAKKHHPKKSSFLPIPLLAKVKYFTIGSAFSFLFLFLPLLMFIFIQDLPNPQDLSLKPIPQTTKIYDRHGVLLYEIYGSQNRTLVTLRDVPIHLQQATLAIEDKNFYKHPGFDIPSIIRALKVNSTGEIRQGGSTITQQLIKSSMLSPEQSISRKVREVVLAFWTEKIYTKNEILEMYFNQIPYGGTAWGVEAASEVYFGKNVRNLTLAESAFLAGITTAPTMYSPYGENPMLWKIRQKEVLKRMVALNYISQDTADQAVKEQIAFRAPQVAMRAPHFVNYVRDLLVQKYGIAMVERGGLSVKTTLDLSTQEMAQEIVTEEVANASYLNVSNGAALVTNPKNGDVLAMIGSKDFADEISGKVNVTTSLRQPGSSIKPVTYAAALAKGFTAASIIEDAPVSYAIPGSAPYSPSNYDGRNYGRVTLRFALANSLNIPAVKLLNQIGVPTMVNIARDMGVESWDKSRPYGLAVTLGGSEVTMLDMATVFATLANSGVRHDINPVLEVTDATGTVIEKKSTVAGRRVLTDAVSFIISDILSDNNARSTAFGPNSPLTIPNHTVSVKTGTTDNKRDNWTIGYTDNFVVAVWVGNNDNSPMSQSLASGITGAAPIWHRIMATLLEKNPEKKPVKPVTVSQQLCFGKLEYFISEGGTQPGCRNPFVTPQPFTRESRPGAVGTVWQDYQNQTNNSSPQNVWPQPQQPL